MCSSTDHSYDPFVLFLFLFYKARSDQSKHEAEIRRSVNMDIPDWIFNRFETSEAGDHDQLLILQIWEQICAMTST